MAKRNLKTIAAILGAAVAAYTVTVVCAYAAMLQPPERFGAIMSKVPSFVMTILPVRALWTSARSGSLRVGDAAPEFLLPAVDGSGAVQLSSVFRERPVVLIFGSYT